MVRAPPRSFDMHFLLGFNIAAVCLKISQNYNEIPTHANFQPKNGKKESSRSMKSGSHFYL